MPNFVAKDLVNITPGTQIIMAMPVKRAGFFGAKVRD
jgi:hypothetical protein